jgi:PAS domain S-box-containing protein
MMILDVRTLLFIFTLLNLLTFAVVALLWLQNRKKFQGMGFWLVNYFLQMLAILFIYLRGSIPDGISIFLPNILAFGGLLLLLIGLQRFIGKTYSQIPNLIILGLAIAFQVYFSVMQPELLARSYLLNIGIIIFVAQCIWVLYRGLNSETRKMTLNSVWAFSFLCVVSIARLLETGLSSGSNNDFFKSGSADMVLLILQQLAMVFITFTLILMTNHRMVSAVQHAQEHLRSSEEKFSKAFRSNPQSVAITSARSGLFLEVNGKFLTDIGYSREELIGHSGIKLGLWPDENKRQANAVDILMQNGRVVNYEIEYRTKSGEMRTWILSGEMLEIEGEPCIIWMNVDITEHKRMFKALQESDAFNISLSDNSPYPIIVMNMDTSVRYINPAFEKLIGYSKEEITGLKQPYPWWSPADIKRYLQEGCTRSDLDQYPHEANFFQKKWRGITS